MNTLFDTDIDTRSRLQRAFDLFDAEHPDVWILFEGMVFGLIDKGVTHYGAKAICETIRFHKIAESTNGERFKLNNNHATYYGRKFEQLHPEYKGFFEKRKVQDE